MDGGFLVPTLSMYSRPHRCLPDFLRFSNVSDNAVSTACLHISPRIVSIHTFRVGYFLLASGSESTFNVCPALSDTYLYYYCVKNIVN